MVQGLVWYRAGLPLLSFLVEKIKRLVLPGLKEDGGFRGLEVRPSKLIPKDEHLFTLNL